MSRTPKHSNVNVQLSGEDGNAFAILGRVSKEMKRAGCTPEEVSAYKREAMSGDYDHLLETTMRHVNVD